MACETIGSIKDNVTKIIDESIGEGSIEVAIKLHETIEQLHSTRHNEEAGVNEVRDLTEEEFDSIFRGAKKGTNDSQAILEGLKELDRKQLGTEFDEAHAKWLSYVLSKIGNTEFKLGKMGIKITAKELAEAVDGAFDPNTGIVSINLSLDNKGQDFRNEFTQSHQEVFIHEIVHAAVEFAMESDDIAVVDTVSNLRRLWETAKASTKEKGYKIFLNEDTIYTEDAIEEAKNMYEYIFNDVNGLKEFTAHLLTNKPFSEAMNKIKAIPKVKKYKDETFTEKVFRLLEEAINKILGRVRNEQGKSVKKAASKLIFKMMQAQEHSIDKLKNKHRFKTPAKAAKWISDQLDKADKKAQKPIDTFFSKILGDKKTKPATVKELRKVIKKLENIQAQGERADGRGKLGKIIGTFHFLRTLPSLRRLGLEIPEVANAMNAAMYSLGLYEDGLIRSFINDFVEHDQTYTEITDKILAITQSIDDERQAIYTTSLKKIYNFFKEDTSKTRPRGFDIKATKNKKYDEALNAVVLKLDLQSLDMIHTELTSMLTDDAALDAEILLLKRQIQNTKMIEDAEKLGDYLATGVGLLTNAENISRNFGYMSAIGYINTNPNKHLVPLIDKLATLHALKQTDKKAKETMAKLIDIAPRGVRSFMQYAKAMQQANIDELEFDMSKYVKGHTKKTIDKDRSVKVMPLSMKKKMKAEGYALKEKLPKSDGDLHSEEYGIYVMYNSAFGKRINGAFGKADRHIEGISLYDMVSIELGNGVSIAEKKKEFRKRVTAATKEYRKIGGNKMNMFPIYGANGKIINFRYTLTHKQERKYEKVEQRGTQNMSRTFSVVSVVRKTRENNLEILEKLKKDYDDNYLKNPDKYVVIESNFNQTPIDVVYDDIDLNDDLFDRHDEAEKRQNILDDKIDTAEIELLEQEAELTAINEFLKNKEHNPGLSEKEYKETLKDGKRKVEAKIKRLKAKILKLEEEKKALSLTRIQPKSVSAKRRKMEQDKYNDLWALLPSQTRKDAAHLFGSGKIIIRRDLIQPSFGYAQMSLANRKQD